MCNAWNHPPGCNCGWGGGNNFDSRNQYMRTQKSNELITVERFSKYYDSELKYLLKFSDGCIELEDDVSSKTFEVECKYCGQKIFYYENKYGSKVFFNCLGNPWEKHECKQYLEFYQNKFSNKVGN